MWIKSTQMETQLTNPRKPTSWSLMRKHLLHQGLKKHFVPDLHVSTRDSDYKAAALPSYNKHGLAEARLSRCRKARNNTWQLRPELGRPQLLFHEVSFTKRSLTRVHAHTPPNPSRHPARLEISQTSPLYQVDPTELVSIWIFHS